MTTTMLDRVVRWNLDLDGDIYGDERERFRWYEGIVTAASVQLLVVPWAAVILVWTLGRPAVLPLAVMLAAFQLPMLLCTAYIRSRRVEVVQRRTRKRALASVLSGLPIVLFVLGAVYSYGSPGNRGMGGALIGALVGGSVAYGVVAWRTSRRRGRESAVIEDEDDVVTA
ncbi:hypothetical protein AB0F81_07050 [Actinoplanes sp. NPDC024001]|uniref:hypothetical protein n=1 Tax=Actinoplanes sp. NPDC024001 TaxID=3154598 RepID=UPI00340901CC